MKTTDDNFIKINNKTYSLFNICKIKDKKIIDNIFTNDDPALQSKIFNKNKNNNFCNIDKNVTYNIDNIGDNFSVGTLNNVYTIQNNEHVYRELKPSQINETNKKDELRALYIQRFLSNKCNNICKVINFGFKNEIDLENKSSNIYLENKTSNIYLENESFNIYAIIEKVTPLDKLTPKHDDGNTDITKFKLSYDQIIKILYEILLGLQYIHSNGFIHNDIKINNIGVVLDGEQNIQIVKIYDFGLTEYLNNNSFLYIKQYIQSPTDNEDHIDLFLRKFGILSKFTDIYGFGYLAYILFYMYYSNNNIDDNTEKIIDLINSCVFPMECKILKNKLLYSSKPTFNNKNIINKTFDTASVFSTIINENRNKIITKINANNNTKNTEQTEFINKLINENIDNEFLFSIIKDKRKSTAKLLNNDIFDGLKKNINIFTFFPKNGGKIKRTYKRRKNSRIRLSKRFK
jgi:serine/threonine protein kinase